MQALRFTVKVLLMSWLKQKKVTVFTREENQYQP